MESERGKGTERVDRYLIPHWSRSALISVDVQNDFSLPGVPLEIPGTRKIMSGVAALLDVFRRRGRPIVHVVRLYLEDGSNVDLCRRSMVEAGKKALVPESRGAEIVEQLSRAPGGFRLDAEKLLKGEFQELGSREFAMFKPRWGAFYKTGLEEFLKTRGIDTLVFCGCNFPNCPRTSIYEASERDFRLVVASDAISGIYDLGIYELQNIGASLLTVREIERLVFETE
ncbi:Nicotinamidase-related amidase [Papillibacter cinnamivorans DSM 12816]|uniref:Nicotinamidase-related amidase n=1 Tax=Papillibacter cinnamivorans DSM 12816 TaxID=1122930 RepID=A0A1W2B7A5_9FIRM|nr:Nicotinamidase-related amidase [Papillibacter cinnamivorans DSM 12816]